MRRRRNGGGGHRVGHVHFVHMMRDKGRRSVGRTVVGVDAAVVAAVVVAVLVAVVRLMMADLLRFGAGGVIVVVILIGAAGRVETSTVGDIVEVKKEGNLQIRWVGFYDDDQRIISVHSTN